MAFFYSWKKGDNLCEIAKRFNASCKDIIRINGIDNITLIKEGDILYIREFKHIKKED